MKINVFAETIFMLISHIDKIPNVSTLIIILYMQKPNSLSSAFAKGEIIFF